MKLSSFVAGAFGTVGFGLSLLAGVSVSNSLESILVRGLMSAGACYVVGYFVGMIAQQISLEHAARVAKLVAEEDAREAQAEAEAEAEREAEAAEVASAGSGVPAASGSA